MKTEKRLFTRVRTRVYVGATFVLLSALACVTPAAAQSASDAPAARAATRRQVVVTIDDLPFTGDRGQTGVDAAREYTAKLLRALTENRIPAVGFVNEGKLARAGEEAARRDLLKMWVDAGFELGNHTYAHRDFNRTPLEAFRQEVIKGEPVTRSLLETRGRKLRYFRHPFLHTGPDLKTKRAFDQFLTARGYQIAPVTTDNAEWIFAQAYHDAKRRGDGEAADRIAAEYTPYMERMFEFYEDLSRELFGREIPQILLIHANTLNADHLDKLVEMMKRRGYSFITLEEALRDKAYEHADNYVGEVGVSWLQRWLVTRGKPFRKEPYLPPYMRQFDPEYSGQDFKTRKGK